MRRGTKQRRKKKVIALGNLGTEKGKKKKDNNSFGNWKLRRKKEKIIITLETLETEKGKKKKENNSFGNFGN